MTSRQDPVEILKKVRSSFRVAGFFVKRRVCFESLLRLGSVPKEDEILGDSIRDFFALREVALKSHGHHIKAFEFLRAECDIPVIGVLREPRKELFEVFDFHKVGIVLKKCYICNGPFAQASRPSEEGRLILSLPFVL